MCTCSKSRLFVLLEGESDQGNVQLPRRVEGELEIVSFLPGEGTCGNTLSVGHYGCCVEDVAPWWMEKVLGFYAVQHMITC